MSTFGKSLIRSAKEAVAIARGEADPATYKVYVPTDLDVKAIRQDLHMTQSEFANRYGFPVATLRDWEQGRGRPDTAARAYLLVISREPKAVERALMLGTQTDPTHKVLEGSSETRGYRRSAGAKRLATAR
jgi:putative transcriptional regulator